jgi:hypothetical protein
LAKEEMQIKSATAIEEFERVARGLPALLQPTEFGSKNVSMNNMLGAFYQEVVRRIFMMMVMMKEQMRSLLVLNTWTMTNWKSCAVSSTV